MDNIIELKNISKSFKNNTVLNNINLNIVKGETVGVVGGNGSGKSVLFKLICGFEQADKGSIYIRELKLGDSFDFPEDVGALINTPGYIDYYSGLRNLQLLAGINNKIDDKKIIETMKVVGLDPGNKGKVKNYSTGMKQKLGIAQAIMENQDIIILDEPFNALDYKTNKEIKNLILDLKKQGKTLLLTSHNHVDLVDLCDKVYILTDGSLQNFEEDMQEEYFG